MLQFHKASCIIMWQSFMRGEKCMEQTYVFMTDSDSDLLYSIADERNIPVVKMPYILDGQEYFDDNGRAGVEKELIDALRCRNGNLEISLAERAAEGGEL